MGSTSTGWSRESVYRLEWGCRGAGLGVGERGLGEVCESQCPCLSEVGDWRPCPDPALTLIVKWALGLGGAPGPEVCRRASHCPSAPRSFPRGPSAPEALLPCAEMAVGWMLPWGPAAPQGRPPVRLGCRCFSVLAVRCWR